MAGLHRLHRHRREVQHGDPRGGEELGQDVGPLVLQDFGGLEHTDVLLPGQLRGVEVLGGELLGHLELPAAHALQQGIDGGDLAVHAADGVILHQQLVPPDLQGVLAHQLFRREKVIELP